MLDYPEFIKDRFKNSEVHIVGSGPSLIGFDYSKLEGKRIITINHAYKLIKSESSHPSYSSLTPSFVNCLLNLLKLPGFPYFKWI